MTIGIERSSWILRAASMPSSRGIFTSRIARSGVSERASAIASSPSRASAHTSCPARSSRSLRSRRMIVSSSATRILTPTVLRLARSQGAHERLRLRPVEELDRVVARAPAVVVVLVVQGGLPALGHLDEKRVHDDLLHAGEPGAVLRLLVERVREHRLEIRWRRVETGLLSQLPSGRSRRRLPLLDAAADSVPVLACARRPVHD